jgi:hypothetical protein
LWRILGIQFKCEYWSEDIIYICVCVCVCVCVWISLSLSLSLSLITLINNKKENVFIIFGAIIVGLDWQFSSWRTAIKIEIVGYIASQHKEEVKKGRITTPKGSSSSYSREWVREWVSSWWVGNQWDEKWPKWNCTHTGTILDGLLNASQVENGGRR